MNQQVLQVVRLFSEGLIDQGAKAVVVFGSQVRGDAYKESDIDIHVIGRGPKYRLERCRGFLLSVSWSTAKNHRMDFRNPGKVGGIIPAWRNAKLFYDPAGVAGVLQREAESWSWALLGKRVDRWVAEELTGWAEEVHRLVGNLKLGRRSAAAVQRSVLAIRMAQVLAVHHRILYDSENRLWDLVSARMGPEWAELQRSALGEEDQSFDETCKASLQLFCLTAEKVKHLLDERQRDVVVHACKIAEKSLFT